MCGNDKVFCWNGDLCIIRGLNLYDYLWEFLNYSLGLLRICIRTSL